MSDRNGEILLGYLQSILRDQQIKDPGLVQLDEPYRRLGEEIIRLRESVDEAKSCLEAALDGNYTCQASFPGDFSHTVNKMIARLQEKDGLLQHEVEQRKLREEEPYNHLLAELTKKRSEWILVVEKGTRNILFCNRKTIKDADRHKEGDFCDVCHYKLSFKPQILNWDSDEPYAIWEAEDVHGNVYQVTSFLTEWQEQKAYAHVIMDTTEEAHEARQLANKAYHDPGTGIENRRYFEEYMDEALKENREITLCYMDLDGLKYVNDKFGHLEGDEYIRSFVALIKTKIRTTDVFARIGGDEFCLILPGYHKDVVNEKIHEALEQMVAENQKPYPASFSFGVIELHQKEERLTLKEILERADTMMYLCKRENKKKYHENREVR